VREDRRKKGRRRREEGGKRERMRGRGREKGSYQSTQDLGGFLGDGILL
jgi:hypothetical protein